jgi:NADPH2:quinone reductase
VIAVAGSPEKLEFCAKSGADYTVNYRTEDLPERIAAITNERGVLDLMLRNLTAVGVLSIAQDDPEAEAMVWRRLAELAGSGAVTTPVGTVYGFGEVPRMVANQTHPGPGTSLVRVSAA